MKSFFLLTACCLATFIGLSQQADIILINGKIFTSDSTRPYVQALAIKGERILAVGDNQSIEKQAGAKTRRIDLQGKTVIPGINDAHDHIGFGASHGRFIAFPAEMMAGPTLQQVLDSLSVITKQVPAGTLIQANLGVILLEDPKARRKALDAVSPNHPVVLTAPWGHGTILNSKALELFGLSETAPDPVGGYYEREPNSKILTGLVREYAEFGILRKVVGQLPDSSLAQDIRQYSDQAVRYGITTVQNMTTTTTAERTLRTFQLANLPIRIRLIRMPMTTDQGRLVKEWDARFKPTPLLRLDGMKYVLDGTPIDRDALMKSSYADRTGYTGRLNFPLDTLRAILREAVASKEQLMLHVVGDSTPTLVMNEMLKLKPAAFWKTKRLRFEHGDGLLPEEFERARSLGIVLVQNPSHFMIVPVLQQRLGAERAIRYQALNSLRQHQIPVALGSDGPNNPYLNIMFAAMHPANPEEAFSREQSVMAYTTGSAYAEFMEKEKGKLLPGMLADLAVLNQDIFTLPLEALPGTQSVMTMVGGRIVFGN